MKKTLTVLAALALGLSFSLQATAADKTLAEIHGKNWPVNAQGYVTKEACKQCHGSYEQLAKATENLEPNPHKNHLGDVNCTECHKADKAKPELMCNDCHKFTIRQKAAAK